MAPDTNACVGPGRLAWLVAEWPVPGADCASMRANRGISDTMTSTVATTAGRSIGRAIEPPLVVELAASPNRSRRGSRSGEEVHSLSPAVTPVCPFFSPPVDLALREPRFSESVPHYVACET